MIADKSRRKWGKIGLARLTIRSLGRRIDYESATSKSRFHHDSRGSFSHKRMLKRKPRANNQKTIAWKRGKMGFIRKIRMFTSTAVGECNTPLSIATPFSVNAYGRLRAPIRIELDVAFCDFQFSNSSWLSWNMKSSGNRSALRLVHPENGVIGLFALFRCSLLSGENNTNNKYNVSRHFALSNPAER